jgi:hypothetical protein
MTNLAEKLFKNPISEPERNKIEYTQDKAGRWAYLTECPTLRAFGIDKQKAYHNLIVLVAELI